jgi:hypothetical protein
MLEKFPGESAVFDIDCSQLLATSETITGTPTMSQLPALTGGDVLTFGSPLVNTQAVTYSDGRVAAIGKAIQVRISGGTAANTKDSRHYSVIATFSTSAGNTLVARALLSVLPADPQ